MDSEVASENELEALRLFDEDNEAIETQEAEYVAAHRAKLPVGYVGEIASSCFESVLELVLDISRS